MQSWPRPCVIMKLTVSGVTLLGGADEIAFVFAVLGIDDDDHPAVADGLDGFFDGGKTAGHAGLVQTVHWMAVRFIIGVCGRGKLAGYWMLASRKRQRSECRYWSLK